MTKYVVVKIGGGVLLTQRHMLDELRIAKLAHQIVAIRKSGVGVALVISGAVACGMKFVNISGGKRFLKILAAGIGQAILVSTFERIFGSCNMHVAQILLTQKDIQRKDADDLAKILREYVEMGIVPLINENDVIELNDFGGNDFLAVEIGRVLGASQLVILSTMKSSVFGVGGGESKRTAVQKAIQLGIHASIADGKTKDILLKTII